MSLLHGHPKEGSLPPGGAAQSAKGAPKSAPHGHAARRPQGARRKRCCMGLPLARCAAARRVRARERAQ